MTEQNINPKDFEKYIKTKCVTKDCNNSLPGTFSFYRNYGNFCIKCCNEASKRAAKRNNVRDRLINKGFIYDR
jgi:hypothetical protein